VGHQAAHVGDFGSKEFIGMTASQKRLVLRGLFPATITPFREDFSVDFDALRRHLRESADVDGVSGIVVNAGLGEIMQLSDQEKQEIIALARQVVRPGQLVIAGIEGRGAAQAVRDGRIAKEAGTDAFLVLPPFDVRPYRRLARHVDSVYRFFATLDRELDHPMIIFQYPDSSGCAYSVEALVAVSSLRNVVAVKAACGTVTRYVQLWEPLHDKVSVLAALDSPPLLGILLHGTHGALIGISVIGTKRWSELVQAAMNNDAAAASRIHREFCIPLMDGVFENQEPSSPTSEVASVKEALVQLGQIPSSRVRPPAVGVTAEHRAHVARALLASGLIKEAKATNVTAGASRQ
jgi:4-hydroxy-tetrahydrodipicolinate synthase